VSELEAHVVHQEGIIQDLSNDIAKQWESIDAFTRTVEQLKDQLLNLADGVQFILPDLADGVQFILPGKPPPQY